MSAMAFREPNQVKWVGTRPGHNGTQVVAIVDAINTTTILWTVTAAKTLYVCTLSMSCYAVANGLRWIAVRNAADVVQYTCMIDYVATGSVPITVVETFWPPLEIPAGWDIVVTSTALILAVRGFVFGWEE